jgi:hypothetical protein
MVINHIKVLLSLQTLKSKKFIKSKEPIMGYGNAYGGKKKKVKKPKGK